MGRRFGDFSRMHKRLRAEIPGKLLPPLPRKIKSSTAANFFGGQDDDASSLSSVSTSGTKQDDASLRSSLGHRRSTSLNQSPRPSSERSREAVHLYREEQRVSLRAFLRTLLQNTQVAESKTMTAFLTDRPVKLNEEEWGDVDRRIEMDEKRIEEQKRFYEIARQRAKELDIYMERFRRDVIESNGLTKLFQEIREKEKLTDLSVQYRKFAEWLRIEYDSASGVEDGLLMMPGSPRPSTISSWPRTIPQRCLPRPRGSTRSSHTPSSRTSSASPTQRS